MPTRSALYPIVPPHDPVLFIEPGLTREQVMPRADRPELTAVRAVAALWVFVYHAWTTVGPQRLGFSVGTVAIDLTPLASVGWAGVDIFYVLSGFLLWPAFDPWASRRSQPPSLARYFERRALRILPAYYAQLAILATLGVAAGIVAAPTIGDLTAHASLTHAWFYHYLVSINAVWWTLSIEAQFYVALPLLAWCVRRAGWGVVLAAGLFATVAWRIGAFEMVRAEGIPMRVWLVEQFPGHLDQFLFGMFAHHLGAAASGPGARLRSWLQARNWRPLLAVGVGPAVLVALAYLLHVDDFYLLYWDGHPWLFFWHTAAGIAVALTLFALGLRPVPSGESNVRIPSRRRQGYVMEALVRLGTVSYSFYLWHEMLLHVTARAVTSVFGRATPLAFAGNLVCGFALSVLVATVWYLMFERPFLRTRWRLRETV